MSAPRCGGETHASRPRGVVDDDDLDRDARRRRRIGAAPRATPAATSPEFHETKTTVSSGSSHAASSVSVAGRAAARDGGSAPRGSASWSTARLPLDREALPHAARRRRSPAAPVATGPRAGERSTRRGARASSGSTRTPVSRCSICSGEPPTRVAITGTPAAIASRSRAGTRPDARRARTSPSDRALRRPAGARACARRRELLGGRELATTALELDVLVQARLADVLEAQVGTTLARERRRLEEDVRSLRRADRPDRADRGRGGSALPIGGGRARRCSATRTGVAPACGRTTRATASETTTRTSAVFAAARSVRVRFGAGRRELVHVHDDREAELPRDPRLRKRPAACSRARHAGARRSSICRKARR